MNSEQKRMQRVYHARWVAKNRKSIQAKARIRRIEWVEWLNEQKTPCEDCGEDNPVVIDFHHPDPSDKKFNIGCTGFYKSREVVLKEIDKCICLCSNCHRILHWEERQ